MDETNIFTMFYKLPKSLILLKDGNECIYDLKVYFSYFEDCRISYHCKKTNIAFSWKGNFEDIVKSVYYYLLKRGKIK